MSDEMSPSSGGIGVVGLLGVVFVTLKLCGVIDWSWWWVTAPFWGPVAIFFGILALILPVLAIICLVTGKQIKDYING